MPVREVKPEPVPAVSDSKQDAADSRVLSPKTAKKQKGKRRNVEDGDDDDDSFAGDDDGDGHDRKRPAIDNN